MTTSRFWCEDRIRVLLAEDQDSVRDFVYSLLESGGYEVLAASNGLDGLTIFDRSVRPVDLLVTDCRMPGLSGLELARACSRRNSSVGVLYMSGCGPDEELLADLDAPRRAFLRKPFHGDDLLRKLRELLAHGLGRDAAPHHQASNCPTG